MLALVGSLVRTECGVRDLRVVGQSWRQLLVAVSDTPVVPLRLDKGEL